MSCFKYYLIAFFGICFLTQVIFYNEEGTNCTKSQKEGKRGKFRNDRRNWEQDQIVKKTYK